MYACIKIIFFSNIRSPLFSFSICSYGPLGGDACKTGAPEEWGDYAIPFVEVSTGLAGPRYLKAQYVEYTDDTFTTKVARNEDEEYMGILGPII